MPRKYYNKSNHNKTFLEKIHEDYPEDFFDWKVTVQFYTGLHKCYCVLLVKDEVVKSSHNQNIKNLKGINPEISRKIFELYKNSRQSRYDGFIDDEAMLRINKINFDRGVSLLRSIESEVSSYYPVTAPI